MMTAPRPPLIRPAGLGPAAEIRLVTFDLDDCLWDSIDVMTRAELARQAFLEVRWRLPRRTPPTRKRSDREQWPTLASAVVRGPISCCCCCCRHNCRCC